MIIDENYDFDFTFMSQNNPYYRPRAGDCIQIIFENPYALEAPGTYQSFDAPPDSASNCKVS